MFRYYNANPLGRKVNDCTVRAISLATDTSWDCAFMALSLYAQREAIMPDDVRYIDGYLRRFEKVHDRYLDREITLNEFLEDHSIGTYLVTMNGHITCCIDGVCYDTFDPSNRYIWDAYKVK